MFRSRSAVLLVAALAIGCAVPATPKPPSDRNDLAIRAELSFDSLPLEGELGTFEVRIKNVSSTVVILRDMVHPEGGTVATWQVSLPGTLEYNARAETFDYDPATRAPQPRPAFNVALLRPGEEILLRPKIRLLHLPRRYSVNYFVLERTDLSSDVYFETRDGRRLRYRRLFGEEIDKALSPGARPDSSSHRTVVYPHAEGLLETPRRQEAVLDVRLDRRPFSLKDAAARAGTTPEQIGAGHTYCSSLEAWILKGPAGTVMVGARETQSVPETDNLEALFFILDSAGSGTATIAVRTPLEMRLAAHNFRLLETGALPHKYTVAVGRNDWKRLLRILAEEKLRLDAEPAGGSLRLVIRR